MAVNYLTIEALARAGSNISIDAKEVNSLTIENLMRICVHSGVNLTIRNAGTLNYLTLQALAKVGRSNVTFEV